jgi:DNA invertase Pin-like site-specific DNA recombinase
MDEFNEGIIAGYARTATTDVKPIIEQVNQIVHYVMEDNLQYSFGLSLYLDKGYSGHSSERPAYLQLINDITDGKICEVLVTGMDRFSRDVKEYEEIINLARIHDVTITTIL